MVQNECCFPSTTTVTWLAIRADMWTSFCRWSLSCTFSRNNETDANWLSIRSFTPGTRRVKQPFVQKWSDLSSDLFSWGSGGGPGRQLTPWPRRKIIKTINSYYSLGPEQGAAFYTSLHITGLLRSRPSDYAARALLVALENYSFPLWRCSLVNGFPAAYWRFI